MTEIPTTTTTAPRPWWSCLGAPPLRGGGLIDGTPEAATADGLNLRNWFAVYLSWMGLLALAAVTAFGQYETTVRPGAQGIWLLSLGLFYLSLCCLFFPAPTAWIVMLLASNQTGLIDSVPLRIAAVACACGLATGMANLNEYHIITFVLRYGRVARLKDTRTYQTAARWFSTSPFMVIVVVGFLPIPVDVVRWLAIAYRYPRSRYFAAYVIGRSFRYAAWAASVVLLDWAWWEILVFQAALVVLAGLKVLHTWLKKRTWPPRDGVPSSSFP